jgi:hypothetical protein
MKCLFGFALLLLSELTTSVPVSPSIRSSIDPTGTYILKGILKKNRITGHSGEIRVKLLAENKIALCFYISSGYPAFESGAFMDTLDYYDSHAEYQPDRDRGCIIQFSFSEFAAETRQLYGDPHSNCGFGKGVMISAVFRKSSNDRPVIQDLSLHRMAP